MGRIVGTEQLLKVNKCAQSIGAGFLGTAYEFLLHNAVHGASAKGEPVVLKMHQGPEFDKIEIRVPHVISSGKDEETCYACLATLDKDIYWYPAYPFFPFIDAVTMCEECSSTSRHSETIVAYIQVTTQKEKKLKPDRLKRLNEEIDKNPQLIKDLKRAFVVVGRRLQDISSPRCPCAFLTMVSCFDPDQLEPHKH